MVIRVLQFSADADRTKGRDRDLKDLLVLILEEYVHIRLCFRLAVSTLSERDTSEKYFSCYLRPLLSLDAIYQ